jgi:hypothetical protein
MAEKLMKLSKKGTPFLEDNFNIWVYGESLQSTSACAGGVFVPKEKLFPKYTQIRYERVSGTVKNVQIRNMDVGQSSDMTLSTSWQNIPSAYMSGSGTVRFQVSTAKNASIVNVKIMLK